MTACDRGLWVHKSLIRGRCIVDLAPADSRRERECCAEQTRDATFKKRPPMLCDLGPSKTLFLAPRQIRESENDIDITHFPPSSSCWR